MKKAKVLYLQTHRDTHPSSVHVSVDAWVMSVIQFTVATHRRKKGHVSWRAVLNGCQGQANGEQLTSRTYLKPELKYETCVV